MQNDEKKRIKSLDGLRGIAILLVLTFHLLNFGFLYPVFGLGWMGVELFFVLSGFLITGILLDTKLQAGFIKSFLVRRALRTMPLYYAVLIIFVFIAPHFTPTKWFTDYQLFFWTHTSNFLFYMKGFFKPLGHFWSLAIEEQFYLFWPFVILIFTSKRLMVFSIVLLALGIFVRIFLQDKELLFTVPFQHLDGILLGAIAAILLRTYPQLLFRHIKKIFAVAAVLFALFIVFNINVQNGLLGNPLTFTVAAIFFGSFLLLSLHSAVMEKLLSNRFLFFFGKYSYGMYVFNSILYHFSNWAGADRLNGNQRLLVYSGVFLLTVVISYCSYHLFESKFLQLKNRFSPATAIS
jgi:peptidoglycan/LPS O-acetylase OafA/YrhL